MTNIQQVKTNLIGNRDFYRKVLLILLPIIIQNTVTNVVSLLDNVMVGRVGTLPMSAVAIVNQLLFIFNLCIFGGLAGAGIFAAQYAGAADHRGIRHCFRAKIYISAAMLLIAFCVFLLIPKPLIAMYLAEGTSAAEAEATMGFAQDYLAIMLIGLIPFALSQSYGSTLRELGETKLPMIASVAAILINLIFNYIFIFGNEGLPFLWFEPMGVAGAAIATVLSRYMEAVIILWFTHKNKERFPFIQGAYRSLKIPMELCNRIAKRGLPLLINEFLWSLGMAMLMQAYSARGLEVVAASNISSTVANLFNVVFLSMGSALAIIVGQQLGANQIKDAKTTVWRLLALSVACCALLGLIMILLAPVIPLIYNTSHEVRTLASNLIQIVGLMMPFMAFCHCCYFTLRSGGKTLITFIFDCGFTWGLAVPLALILAHLTPLPILPLFFIIQAIEAVKCIVGGFLIKSGIWINNIVE